MKDCHLADLLAALWGVRQMDSKLAALWDENSAREWAVESEVAMELLLEP